MPDTNPVSPGPFTVAIGGLDNSKITYSMLERSGVFVHSIAIPIVESVHFEPLPLKLELEAVSVESLLHHYDSGRDRVSMQYLYSQGLVNQKGLEPCPPEAALQLFTQYHKMLPTPLIVAMKPIVHEKRGHRCVFVLSKYNDRLNLFVTTGAPCFEGWYKDQRLLFARTSHRRDILKLSSRPRW